MLVHGDWIRWCGVQIAFEAYWSDITCFQSMLHFGNSRLVSKFATSLTQTSQSHSSTDVAQTLLWRLFWHWLIGRNASKQARLVFQPHGPHKGPGYHVAETRSPYHLATCLKYCFSRSNWLDYFAWGQPIENTWNYTFKILPCPGYTCAISFPLWALCPAFGTQEHPIYIIL